jgi:hypothetical protein
MSKNIVELVDKLSTGGLTVRMLQGIDFVAPGEWHNLTGFTNSIKVLTGEDDEARIQKIGERAIALYNDKSQGYQRAQWWYEKIDSLQGWLGAMAMANKVGERYSSLAFLQKITPKHEKAHVIDAGVKLVTEVGCFCSLNGIPGDSIKDFVKSLTNYREESLIRMAALICIDGILPLGPDCISKVLSLLQSSGTPDLEQSERYQNVKEMIPGNGVTGHLGFIRESVGSVTNWMKSFVADRQVTIDKIAGGLQKYVDFAGNKLDYLAAYLQMTTNYFEHTGTQSVARAAIMRAVAEI